MNLQIQNFYIRSEDEFNFALYEVKKKRQSEHETVEKLHGYFGDLPSTINKLMKLAYLNAQNIKTLQDLEQSLQLFNTLIHEKFADIKPKQYAKKELVA